MRGQQVFVGGIYIGVADHYIGEHGAGLLLGFVEYPNSFSPFFRGDDFLHGVVEVKYYTLSQCQLIQGLGNADHAPIGVVGTELLFQMGNHVEQRRRTVGVAPVISSKSVEVLHQVFVAHLGAVFAVHRLKQVQFGCVKQSFEGLEIEVVFNFVQALFDEQWRGGVVAKSGFVELFFQCQSLRFSGDAFQGCGKIVP